MPMPFQQDSSIYTCNNSHRIVDATLKTSTAKIYTTYGGIGGFGRLWLLLSADAVKVGFGTSAGGRTGIGGFSMISLLQYCTSVSSSSVTGLAKLEACN
jgi:hypothetical protein